MRIALCLLAAFWFTACSKPATPPAGAASQTQTALAPSATPAASPVSVRPEGVSWFEGSVEEALDTAMAENKPLLLYWSAVWCPPCHQLKATVFRDARFLEKTQQFVAVYLDGDEPGAQRWGEEFRITGYPTMLALNADRSEIKRIAGGAEPGLYASILDDALENRSPAMTVLAAVTKGKSSEVTLENCRRLAWNAWGLSDEVLFDGARIAGQLATAAERCAKFEPVFGLRLQAFAATAMGNSGVDDPALMKRILPALQQGIRPDIGAHVQADALRYFSPAFFETLKRRDENAAKELAVAYVAVMREAATYEHHLPADHLGAYYSGLLADKATQGETLNSSFAQEARQRVAKELAALPRDAYLRSGVVTGLWEVLDALGDHQQAYELVRKESEQSTHGYYFMSMLADSAESLGKSTEALQWYERAYRESKGAATRFQWGVSYLQALLRLAPTDASRISSSGQDVLKELSARDAIYRRSRIRLQQLEKALLKWESESPQARKPVIDSLRSTYLQTCGTGCREFLSNQA